MSKKNKYVIPDLSVRDSENGTKLGAKSLFEAYKTNKEATSKTISSSALKTSTSTLVTQPAQTISSSSLKASTSGTQSAQTKGNDHVEQTSGNSTTTPGCQVGDAKTTVQTSSSNNTAAGSRSVDGTVQKPSPSRPGSSTSLIVSARQRVNPLLKFIKNVSWEFGDIVPDYVMGRASCALFLSLRYHQLNQDYIHQRLKQLAGTFDLRLLLVQVDVKDPHHSLKSLAEICLMADCTLILAWSPEEAARYLEAYKAFEHKPPDLIMEKTETDYLGRVTDFITSARKVNKTDAMTLLSSFGSIEGIVKASEEDLSLCPGFGPQKAKKLHDVLNEPFLKKKKVPTATLR